MPEPERANLLAMDAACWARLSGLIDEALELEPQAREPWLAALQHGDAASAVQVRQLLAQLAHAEAQGFLGVDLAPPGAPAEAGQKFGPYELQRPLGAGGMGAVWLARRADGRYDAEVAIKLPHHFRVLGGQAQRFHHEARMLARLEHPHIARLLDAGVGEGGLPYLVLERVRGEPIGRWCDARRLPLRGRLALFLDVLDAVGHAHAALVAHGDLKPANILVSDAGEVKLLDFGIARLLQADDEVQRAAPDPLAGLTPDYAAPEQLAGQPVGAATDVYTLGLVLHELLCGARYAAGAGGASTRADAAAAQARGCSTRGLQRALRGDLEAILQRALQPQPERRYASVFAFAEDLRRHLRTEPVEAVQAGPLLRAGKFMRRQRWPLAAAGVIVAALLVGLAGTLLQAQRAAQQALLARQQRDVAERELKHARATEEFLIFLLSAHADRPLSAADLLQRGEQMARQQFAADPAQRARLMQAIAGVYYEIDAAAAFTALMREAAQAAAQMPDVALQASIECALAGDLGSEPDAQKSRTRLDAALARLQPLGPQARFAQATCLNYRGARALEDWGVQAAERDFRRALELLSAPDDPSQRMLVLSLRQNLAGALAKRDQVAQAVRELRLQLQELEALGRGRTGPAVAVRNNVGVMLYRAGDRLGAVRHFEESIALSGTEPGHGTAATMQYFNVAINLVAVGRLDEARGIFERALAQARERGDDVSAAFAIAGHLDCAPGQLPECLRRLEWARQQLRQRFPPSHPIFAVAAFTDATLALGRGDRSAAQRHVQAAVESFAPLPTAHPHRLRALLLQADLLLDEGRAEAAAAPIEAAASDAERLAAQFPHSEWRGHVALVRARWHRMRGEAGAAQAQLLQALEQLRATVGDAGPLTLRAQALAAELEARARVPGPGPLRR